MRFLYTIIVFIISCLLFPIFLLHPRGRIRILERYGLWKKLPVKEFVWFHGSSVGEVQGLIPLMTQWKKRFPQDSIVLTVTSPTGLTLKNNPADYSFLIPYDCSLYFGSLFRNYKIKKFIFGETELWPNLLWRFHKEAIPVHLVNGVLSDDSYKQYMFIRFLISPVLRTLKNICVADKVSHERFISLGAPQEIVQLVGNAKYEKSVGTFSVAERNELKKEYFTNKSPVLTLGSIHPGEESYWFEALRDFQLKISEFSVIIAPRHLEKLSYFESQLKKYEIDFCLRTDKNGFDKNVCLLDTFGELEKIYAFSDAAFVGGTLVKIGGHNPLEPAGMNCVPIVGPHSYKIQPIAEALLAENALIRIQTKESIKKCIEDLFMNTDHYKNMGSNALTVWKRYQGVSERIFEYLI